MVRPAETGDPAWPAFNVIVRSESSFKRFPDKGNKWLCQGMAIMPSIKPTSLELTQMMSTRLEEVSKAARASVWTPHFCTQGKPFDTAHLSVTSSCKNCKSSV